MQKQEIENLIKELIEKTTTVFDEILVKEDEKEKSNKNNMV